MVPPKNPYPGARPLSSEAKDALVGRDALLNGFADLATQYSVLLITGPSGVGKSSFLQAGVEGRLGTTSAWNVYSIREWTPPFTSEDDLLNYALLLATARNDEELKTVIPTDPRDYIDWVYGRVPTGELAEHLARPLPNSRSLLVLDQFEELLRHEPQIGRRLLNTIAYATDRYAGSRVTHVLSLRQEFEHELRSLQLKAPPGVVTILRIPALGLDCLRDIICGPLERPGIDLRAEDSLVDSLERSWMLAAGGEVSPAKEGTFSTDDTDLGLLHVQAFLYNLYEAVAATNVQEIGEKEAASALDLEWPSDRSDRQAAQELFRGSLPTYVDGRLLAKHQETKAPETKDQETKDQETDPDLGLEIADEILSMAARLVPKLSSAGYKLFRSVDGLAAELLTEFHDLYSIPKTNDTSLERLVQRVVKEARAMPTPREHWILAECVKRHFKPDWESSGMVCGRMADATVFDTAAWVVEAYLGALDWLQDIAVLRATPLGSEQESVGSEQEQGSVPSKQEMVAIVHDGFGPALIAWSREQRLIPRLRVRSLVKLSGQQVLGLPTTNEGDALVRKDLPKTTSLGWLGCNVTARFHDLDFEDCDFAGTLFNQCVFKNVTFKNCKLWGTLFVGCKFTGDTGFRVVAKDLLPRSERARIQTLTFGPECVAEEGGVTIEGYSGYGYFVDEAQGGPWRIKDSDVQHVGIFQGKKADLGPIYLSGKRRPKLLESTPKDTDGGPKVIPED